MTDVRTQLTERRSVSIPLLQEPGPGGAELDEIMQMALRVPDHGKLAPWRLILIRGASAERLGHQLADLAEGRQEGSLNETQRRFEETRFTRAPLVVCVVSTAAPHPKIPEWEQVLSAGALAMNLTHAFYAAGYGTNWVTEWPAYDGEAKAILGVEPSEKIVGFIHVGTPSERLTERPRPSIEEIVREA